MTKRKKRKLKSSEVDDELETKAQTEAHLRTLNTLFISTIQVLVSLLSSDKLPLQLSAFNNLMAIENLFIKSEHPDIKLHRNTLFSWVMGILVNLEDLNSQIVDILNEVYVSKEWEFALYLMENLTCLMNRRVNNLISDSDVDFYGNVHSPLKIENVLWISDNAKFCKNAFQLLSLVEMGSIKNILEQSKAFTSNKDSIQDNDEDSVEESISSENSDEEADPSASSQSEDVSAEDDGSDNDLDSGVLMEQDDFQRLRKAFSSAWLEYLLLDLPNSLYKAVLEGMNSKIIPYLTKPILLYEFLSDSYGIGGSVSILALESLFTLIRKHNVDYPDFFQKLYALFTPELFYMKSRSKFFIQAYMFLKTSRLPTATVCSFIKRLARLALTAPPQGQLVIVALIYNLLIKHPSSHVLIHRVKKNGEPKKKEQTKFPLLLTLSDTIELMETDPFDPKEINPLKSNAIESSLWELKCLVNHYVPWVSDIVNTIFGATELKRSEFNLADFSTLSYTQLFQTEFKRKNKNNAPSFQDPVQFFDQSKFLNFDL